MAYPVIIDTGIASNIHVLKAAKPMGKLNVAEFTSKNVIMNQRSTIGIHRCFFHDLNLSSKMNNPTASKTVITMPQPTGLLIWFEEVAVKKSWNVYALVALPPVGLNINGIFLMSFVNIPVVSGSVSEIILAFLPLSVIIRIKSVNLNAHHDKEIMNPTTVALNIFFGTFFVYNHLNPKKIAARIASFITCLLCVKKMPDVVIVVRIHQFLLLMVV